MNNKLIIEGYVNRFNRNENKRKPITIDIDSLQDGGEISYLKTYNKNFYTESSNEKDNTPYPRFTARITNPTQSSLPSRVEVQEIQQEESEKPEVKEDTEEWNDIDDVTLFEEDIPDDIKNHYTNGHWESRGNHTIFIPNGKEYTQEDIEQAFNRLDDGELWRGQRGTFVNGRYESVNEQMKPQTNSIDTVPFNTETVGYSNNGDNASYIHNALRNGGLEDWEALGFLAVMYNESRLNPNAENEVEKRKWVGNQSYKYGRGLCQWSLDRNNSFRNFMQKKYGTPKWANEASIDDQLEFALAERSERKALLSRIQEIKQMYTNGSINKKTAAKLAADAYRRGFENGTNDSLVSSEYMNRYTKVGGPNAQGFTSNDNKAVENFMHLLERSIKSSKHGGLLPSKETIQKILNNHVNY